MSKRRTKGDGSLFPLPNGTWRGYISLGEGKRKYVSGATRKECQDKIRTLQQERDKGRNLGHPEQTVEQFLTSWLDQVVKHQNAPRTYASYADMCQRHIIPALGKRRLSNLHPEQVQALLNNIVEAGYRPRTAAYARAILRAALNVAIKYGYLTRNVAAMVDAPKDENPFEGQAMTVDQVQVFLGAIEGHRLTPLYRLTLALGLRRGEVINLQWQHLNLTAQTLTIVESKTGKRTVTLTTGLCDMLRRHKIAMAEEQLGQSHWTDHGLIFPSDVGTPLSGRNVTRHFKRMLSKAKLPASFRFHDLRHTAASLMAANGVHPRVAMEILGHRQIATTMEVYSHVNKPEQQRAIETIETLFGT